MKSNSLLIKISVAVTYFAMLAVNALANILPINGVNTGEVSDAYPNLFAPAPLTFSIWGLIYLLLAAYTLYQFGLFQADRGEKRDALFEKIGVSFIITSVANIFWIFAWHYDLIGISVLLMLVILIFLIRIADVLNGEQFSLKEKLFIALPFRVYFGWITVATIANITTFLVSTGWNGFGIPEQVWTVLILIVGAAIGILRMLKDRSIAYGMVFVWAYTGIWIKHASSTGFDGQYLGIIITLVIGIVLFLIADGFLLFRRAKTEATTIT